MQKKSDLYRVLGVGRDAGKDEIRKAFRDKAKKHHPDAGGDPEQFHKVTMAHMVLSDPEKRKRYDETGQWDGVTQDTPEQRAMGLIAAALFKIVQGEREPAECDLIGLVIAELEEQAAPGRAELRKVNFVLARTVKIRGRFKHKKKKANMIERILDAQQRGFEENKRLLETRIAHIDKAIEMVSDYTFRADPAETIQQVRVIRPMGGLGSVFGGFST